MIREYLGDEAGIRVGAFASIADNVELIPGGNHRLDWVSTYPFRVKFRLPGAITDGHPWSKGDIVIGNDVWIGTGARILSGVVVGDGAVVGAAAVVTTDVRPYAVVAGNPAREVKRRFDDATVEALLRIRWWDWPDEELLQHVDGLCSDDVRGFLDLAQQVTDGMRREGRTSA
jgi:acetyltransferase-like isoleucine patch superfamily enzyme